MAYYKSPDSVSPTWLRQVATALSTKYNVTLREGKGWAMDIEKHVLTYHTEHLLALDRDTCLGILLHELGHLHFTDNKWVPGAKLQKNPGSLLQTLSFNAVNAFEDIRVNELMSKSYGGSRSLIDAMNELLAGDSVNHLLQASESFVSNTRSRANMSMHEAFEVFYIAMLKYEGLFPSVLTKPYYDPRKLQLADEIVAEGKIRKLEELKSTGEIYDFVEQEVFPRLAEYLPPPEPPQSGDGDSGGEMGQGESSEADGKSTPAELQNRDGGDSVAENGAGKSNSSTSDTATGEKEGASAENSKQQSSSSTEGADSNTPSTSTTMTAEGSQGVGNVPPHGSQEAWVQDITSKIRKAIERGRVNPDDENRTHPFGNAEERVNSHNVTQIAWHCDASQYDQESKALQARFKNKFATVFRDNQYKREVPRQRRGRIDTRSLHKFALGKTNLFKRKLDTNKKDYAVSFLLDMSGSMGTDRIRGSFHALLAFTNALHAMSVPYSVGYFGERGNVAKYLGDKKVTLEELSLSASSVGAGTTAPATLMKALLSKDLAKHKAKEKLAVILTDGDWLRQDYDKLRTIAKQNPDMRIYMIALEMGERATEDLRHKTEGYCTVLEADDADGIVEQYIEIAKKHLV